MAAPRLTALPQLGADPIDYVVAQRFVSEGEMVRAFPSTPVLELVIDRVLKLRARVPERFSSQIKVGQTVEVRVDAWPDTIFPASVTRLSPTVDARNRTFELEAAVPNPDRRLKAGGFAKADIVVNEVAEATTIPLEALVRFAGVNKVFRVDKGVARETLVDLGGHGPGWVEVTRGLAPGDEVATSGVGQLADGRKLAQSPRPDAARTDAPRTDAPPRTDASQRTAAPPNDPPPMEAPPATTPPATMPPTDALPADSSPSSPPAKAATPLGSRPQGGDGASAPAATGATP